ncbi:hypothetical protein HK101_005661, partial [Irineochytrium annulatum]
MRSYRTAAYFPACFCVSELTVVPSNLLWILQNLTAAGLPSPSPALSSRLQTPLLILRAILFTLLRLPAGPLCLLYAVQGERGQTWAEKVERFWSRYRRLPALVSWLSAFNIATLSGLNVWWTVLVYKALFRHLMAVRAAGAQVVGAVAAAALVAGDTK